MPRPKRNKGREAADAFRQPVQQSTKTQRLESIRWQENGDHLANFGAIYFPREFRSGTSPDFHRQLFRDYYKWQINIETWPRGFAKTTILKTLIRYHAVTHGMELVPEQYQSPVQLFIGKTETIGGRTVGAIMRTMENNNLIRSDFGDLIGSGKWTERELMLANGAYVIGAGALTSSRGLLTDDGDRPTSWFVDDLVDKKIARSIELMIRIPEWIEEEVINLEGAEEARGLITGNRMHRKDHLGYFKNRSKEERIVAAGIYHYTEHSAVIERDAAGKIVKTLWQDYWTPEKLERKLLKIGSKAFRRELQNEPEEEGELSFNYDAIQRYKYGEGIVDPKWPGSIAIDLAIGTKKKNDYTVILVGKRSTDRKLFADRGFRGKIGMERGVDIALDYLESDPTISVVGIETVAYQSAFVERFRAKMRDRGLRCRVVEIKHTTDKLARIQGIADPVNNGDIRINEKLWWLIEECSDHPNGEHDDGPDDLEMLDSLNRKKMGEKQYSGIGLVGRDQIEALRKGDGAGRFEVVKRAG